MMRNRHSIRLPGYDYSIPEFYFITICTANKKCLFGYVHDGKMILNRLGWIAHNELLNTSNVRRNVKLYEFVIMPNHVHAIIQIMDGGVCNTPLQPEQSFTITNNDNDLRRGVLHTPQLRSPSQTLGAIVRGYKGAVSKQIGYAVWQRNYYEHIIRDSADYENIRGYIATNSQTWDADSLYKRSVAEFNKNLKI